MKRINMLLAFMGYCVLLAQAHEFWLQPDTFFAQPGQVVTIEVLVGEHFNGERSEGKKNRLVQYAHWTEGANEDLSSSLTEDHYGTVPLNVTKPGTHLVAFANTNKFLSMRADSFNRLSLVQMVPTTDTKEADWQSYWGSLTFGCR